MEIDEQTMEENLEEDVEEIEDVEDVQSDSDVLKLTEELNTYKERFMRTAAEYDNFRKRTEKEKIQTYSNAVSRTILAILPAVDSIDMAQKASEGGSEEYKKGILMVKAQFDEAFKKLGVESFGEIGDEFNPDIHNAVSHIEDKENQGENVISEVFQKGYKLNDKVIRHAMVQVVN